mmetsp:Transcript_8522/g.24452  ORF Transcript_8522/g.24452 Transcript_8522/m.24452 type:complete len:1333 (-) Transcript_8522:290-4288(-)
MATTTQYPTGPPVTTTPLITSAAHPVLLPLYAFWVATAVVLLWFWQYRNARAKKAELSRHARSTRCSYDAGGESSLPPKAKGGFGGMRLEQSSATGIPSTIPALRRSTDGAPSSKTDAPRQEGSGEMSQRRKSHSSYSSEFRMDMPDETLVRRSFYRNHLFGSLAFSFYIAFLVHLYLIFVVLLIDNYWGCQFRHIDNMCFIGSHPVFGSYAINSYIFFVVWHSVLLFYGFSLMHKSKLRNWFRMPCDPEEAEYAWIWTKIDEEVKVDERQISPVVKAVKRIKAAFVKDNGPSHEETVDVSVMDSGSRYYQFQGSKFVLSDEAGDYRCSRLELGFSLADLHKCQKGLYTSIAMQRRDILGSNTIPYRVDTYGSLLCKEFFSYFYIYQLLMYMVWFWYSYLVTGSLVFSVVILSGFVKVCVVRKSQQSMKKLTDYVTLVDVKRDGSWITVESNELVPGDIIQVYGDWVMPCDAVILHGAAVCNESSLTGEPMPLQKVQAPPDDEEYEPKGRSSRYTLFAGTTVLQAGHKQGDAVEAVVTGTGMNTSKGEIMSAILFPTPLTFKYNAELPVVIMILFAYAALNFGLSLYLILNNGTARSSWVTSWCSAVFTVSQVLSPLLPVALVAGQIKASSRLKDAGIFCLNPDNIPICGKIRVFCFDKTGTLTREGLDFMGFWPVTASQGQPELVPDGMAVATKGDMCAQWGEAGLWALACCHSVSEYDEQYVGNQLEVAMFTATGWILSGGEDERAVVAPKDGSDSLTTIRRFEFDHGRQTMSVVVRDHSGNVHAFLKGSFERVGQMAHPASLPDDYLQKAQDLALDGCYVLGVAHRELGKMSEADLSHMSRDEAEKGGSFIGLLAFRNELKPDSAEAIAELRCGDVRTVMITGDNAMCGLYIARQAGMLKQESKVLLAEEPPTMVDTHGKAVGANPVSTVKWKVLGSHGEEHYTTNLLYQGKVAEQLRAGLLELAVSGAAFDSLQATGDMERLLLYTRIFARVSPEKKVDIVRMHQAKGLIVGMCGDGGNDCGALRVAHSGIALSDAEASVVSSFTSKAKSCKSVVDLLREGRTALHSSFGGYKFLIMYGQLFSLMKVVMFYSAVVPSRLFYFSTDVVAVLFMTWAMSFSTPRPHLEPYRPTSSLLGANTLASVIGLQAIYTATFITVVTMVFSHPDYVPWPRQLVHWKENWLHADNWEATAIAFPMFIMFISSGVIFSFGYKFRMPVYRNLPLMAVYLTLLSLQGFLLLSPPNTVSRWWHVASEAFNRPGTTVQTWSRYQLAGGQPSSGMPFDLRASMLALTLTGVVAGALWQLVVVEGPIRRAAAAVFPGKRPKLLL